MIFPTFPDLDLYEEITDENCLVDVGDIIVTVEPHTKIVDYRLLVSESEFPEKLNVGACYQYGIIRVLRKR